MTKWILEKKYRAILAGVLIVAAPLVCLALFIFFSLTHSLEQKKMDENRALAEHLAHNIEEKLERDIALGKAYSTRPLLVEGIRKNNREEMVRHIKSLVENSLDIERALIVSPKGILLADYPSAVPSVIGQDRSSKDWFREISGNWEPDVSEYFMRGAAPYRYIFVIAIPVTAEDNSRAGIILVQPKDSYIREAIGDMGTSIGKGIVFMVDKRGNLIYHSEYPVDRIIAFSNVPAVRNLMNSTEGADVFVDPLSKDKVLAAYHPGRKWGWGLVVQLPLKEVFRPVHNVLSGLFVVTAIMVIWGGFFAYKGAELLISLRDAGDALRLDEDRLETLLRLSQMKAETEKELTAFALEEAVRLTRSDGGYLHFFNEDTQSVELYSWSKDVLKTCKAAKEPHYPLNAAGVWADSVRLRKAVIHNDYQALATKKGYPAGHLHIKRHLGVPTIDGERIVGIAGVCNKQGPYNGTDVRQLTLLMNSMWGILKQKRLVTELEEQAVTDGLTGLANRRHFNNALDLEIKRARRDKDKTFSLLMCDVDFFKQYNDHYGHIAGDRCLQKVADVLRRVFRRATDLSARYGGEEFAVIIPDTPKEHVWRLAEVLRKEIMAEAIPHARSDAAPVITLSIGFVSTRVTKENSAEWFIQQADEALYRSKTQGRNLVNAVGQEG